MLNEQGSGGRRAGIRLWAVAEGMDDEVTVWNLVTLSLPFEILGEANLLVWLKCQEAQAKPFLR